MGKLLFRNFSVFCLAWAAFFTGLHARADECSELKGYSERIVCQCKQAFPNLDYTLISMEVDSDLRQAQGIFSAACGKWNAAELSDDQTTRGAAEIQTCLKMDEIGDQINCFRNSTPDVPPEIRSGFLVFENAVLNGSKKTVCCEHKLGESCPVPRSEFNKRAKSVRLVCGSAGGGGGGKGKGTGGKNGGGDGGGDSGSGGGGGNKLEDQPWYKAMSVNIQNSYKKYAPTLCPKDSPPRCMELLKKCDKDPESCDKVKELCKTDKIKCKSFEDCLTDPKCTTSSLDLMGSTGPSGPAPSGPKGPAPSGPTGPKGSAPTGPTGATGTTGATDPNGKLDSKSRTPGGVKDGGDGGRVCSVDDIMHGKCPSGGAPSGGSAGGSSGDASGSPDGAPDGEPGGHNPWDGKPVTKCSDQPWWQPCVKYPWEKMDTDECGNLLKNGPDDPECHNDGNPLGIAAGPVKPLIDQAQMDNRKKDAAGWFVQKHAEAYLAALSRAFAQDPDGFNAGVNDLLAACPGTVDSRVRAPLEEAANAAKAEFHVGAGNEEEKDKTSWDKKNSFSGARTRYIDGALKAARRLAEIDKLMETYAADRLGTIDEWEKNWPGWAPCRTVINVIDQYRKAGDILYNERPCSPRNTFGADQFDVCHDPSLIIKESDSEDVKKQKKAQWLKDVRRDLTKADELLIQQGLVSRDSCYITRCKVKNSLLEALAAEHERLLSEHTELRNFTYANGESPSKEIKTPKDADEFNREEFAKEHPVNGNEAIANAYGNPGANDKLPKYDPKYAPVKPLYQHLAERGSLGNSFDYGNASIAFGQQMKGKAKNDKLEGLLKNIKTYCQDPLEAGETVFKDDSMLNNFTACNDKVPEDVSPYWKNAAEAAANRCKELKASGDLGKYLTCKTRKKVNDDANSAWAATKLIAPQAVMTGMDLLGCYSGVGGLFKGLATVLAADTIGAGLTEVGANSLNALKETASALNPAKNLAGAALTTTMILAPAGYGVYSAVQADKAADQAQGQCYAGLSSTEACQAAQEAKKEAWNGAIRDFLIGMFVFPAMEGAGGKAHGTPLLEGAVEKLHKEALEAPKKEGATPDSIKKANEAFDNAMRDRLAEVVGGGEKIRDGLNALTHDDLMAVAKDEKARVTEENAKKIAKKLEKIFYNKKVEKLIELATGDADAMKYLEGPQEWGARLKDARFALLQLEQMEGAPKAKIEKALAALDRSMDKSLKLMYPDRTEFPKSFNDRVALYENAFNEQAPGFSSHVTRAEVANSKIPAKKKGLLAKIKDALWGADALSDGGADTTALSFSAGDIEAAVAAKFPGKKLVYEKGAPGDYSAVKIVGQGGATEAYLFFKVKDGYVDIGEMWVNGPLKGQGVSKMLAARAFVELSEIKGFEAELAGDNHAKYKEAYEQEFKKNGGDSKAAHYAALKETPAYKAAQKFGFGVIDEAMSPVPPDPPNSVPILVAKRGNAPIFALAGEMEAPKANPSTVGGGPTKKVPPDVKTVTGAELSKRMFDNSPTRIKPGSEIEFTVVPKDPPGATARSFKWRVLEVTDTMVRFENADHTGSPIEYPREKFENYFTGPKAPEKIKLTTAPSAEKIHEFYKPQRQRLAYSIYDGLQTDPHEYSGSKITYKSRNTGKLVEMQIVSANDGVVTYIVEGKTKTESLGAFYTRIKESEFGSVKFEAAADDVYGKYLQAKYKLLSNPESVMAHNEAAEATVEYLRWRGIKAHIEELPPGNPKSFLVVIDPAIEGTAKPSRLTKVSNTLVKQGKGGLAFDTAKLLDGGAYYDPTSKVTIVSWDADIPIPGETTQKPLSSMGVHEAYHMTLAEEARARKMAIAEKKIITDSPVEGDHVKIGTREYIVVDEEDGGRIVLREVDNGELVEGGKRLELTPDEFKQKATGIPTVKTRAELPMQVYVGGETKFDLPVNQDTYGKGVWLEEADAYRKSAAKPMLDAKRALEACLSGEFCDYGEALRLSTKYMGDVGMARDHFKATIATLTEVLKAIDEGKISPADIMSNKPHALDRVIRLPDGRTVSFSSDAINLKRPSGKDWSFSLESVREEFQKLLDHTTDHRAVFEKDVATVEGLLKKVNEKREAIVAGKEEAPTFGTRHGHEGHDHDVADVHDDDKIPDTVRVPASDGTPALSLAETEGPKYAGDTWEGTRDNMSKADKPDAVPLGMKLGGMNYEELGKAPADKAFSASDRLASQLKMRKEPGNGAYSVDVGGQKVPVKWSREVPWFQGELTNGATRTANPKGSYQVYAGIPPEHLGDELAAVIALAQKDGRKPYRFVMCGLAAQCGGKNRFFISFDSHADAVAFAKELDAYLAKKGYPPSRPSWSGQVGQGHVGIGFDAVSGERQQTSVAMALTEGKAAAKSCADAACSRRVMHDAFIKHGLDPDTYVPLDPSKPVVANVDPVTPKGSPSVKVEPATPGVKESDLVFKPTDDPAVRRADYTSPTGEKIDVWVKPDPAGEAAKIQRAHQAALDLGLETIVVPRADTAIIGGEPHVVSEHMSGVDIFSTEAKKLGITPAEWAKFKAELMRLRENGIAHGDLYGNILVERVNGKIKFRLIDWDGKDLLGYRTNSLDALVASDEYHLAKLENLLFPDAPKPAPLKANSVIMDANLSKAAAARKAKGGLPKPGEADWRTSEVTARTTDTGAPGFKLTAARTDKSYLAVAEVLADHKVGGNATNPNRVIVADAFFAETTPPGGKPIFTTSDPETYNALLRLAGYEPTTLGKPLREAFPNGFDVTVNDRTIHVLAVERPGAPAERAPAYSKTGVGLKSTYEEPGFISVMTTQDPKVWDAFKELRDDLEMQRESAAKDPAKLDKINALEDQLEKEIRERMKECFK